MIKLSFKNKTLVLFITIIISYTVANNLLYVFCLALWLIYLLSNFKIISQFLKLKNSQLLLLFFLFTVTLGLINLGRNFNIIIGIVFSVFSFLLGVISINFPFLFNTALKQLLIFCQISLICFIVYYGFSDFPAKNPISSIVSGGSSNGITTTLSLIQATYFISCFFLKKKTNLILPFVTLLICLSGYGRGSILLSLGIIFLSISLMMEKKKGYKILFISIMIFSFSLYSYNKNQDDISRIFKTYSKFSGSGIVSSPREQMLNDYYLKITKNLNFLFFGSNYDGTVIKSKYNNNPHNSFIRGHSFYGITFFIFHLFFISFFLKNIKSIFDFIIISIFLLLIFVRISSEIAFFGLPLDFLLYYIMFTGIYSYNQNLKSIL
jgi:hypothetical protein